MKLNKILFCILLHVLHIEASQGFNKPTLEPLTLPDASAKANNSPEPASSTFMEIPDPKMWAESPPKDRNQLPQAYPTQVGKTTKKGGKKK